MVMFYSSLFTFAPNFVEFWGTVPILSYLHSSFLAERIPWTEEHAGIQSNGVAKSQTQT